MHDLIYLDVNTTLRLDPDDGQDPFSDLGFKAEMRPFSWLLWDFDGTFNIYDGSIQTFNTQLQVYDPTLYQVGLDYRYANDRRNQVAADGVLFPNQPWSLRAYVRYDIEHSNLEEHSYYIIHRTRCLGMGVGIRIRPDEAANGDDDYTFWFRLWPLAFPGFANAFGGR